MSNDKRLIEDYLPIQSISAEGSREKSVRDGHISTLHLWWARRPLVACRAAVYASLIPASRFQPPNGQEEKRASLTRANAAKFVKALCTYPGSRVAITEAEKHILEAHSERLSREQSRTINVDDILDGRAPRPRVLDMFAGGGAIPLEALRLGCETYALDLNPVAHVIQLCTLVYPEQFGAPDGAAKGTAQNGSWAGLAKEVSWWGEWLLKKVRAEVGDLYAPVSELRARGKTPQVNAELWEGAGSERKISGLTPLGYLWTRTISCKNPNCRATVPLVRQTWLCKKSDRYVAMRRVLDKEERRVHFKVIEALREKDLQFDPEEGSKGGNATCPFCGTVADNDYVRAVSKSVGLGHQLMAVVCAPKAGRGKVYFSADDIPKSVVPDAANIRERIRLLCERAGFTPLDERIEANPRSFDTQHYGIEHWNQLFTDRQLLTLLTFAAAVRELANSDHIKSDPARKKAIVVTLALLVSRMANFSSTLCLWNYTGGRGVVHSFSRQSLPMTWDFPESNPFYPEAAGWISSLETAQNVFENLPRGLAANVSRGNAQSTQFQNEMFDAVITDPPYYDNVSYSNLSDFFYVWLKRMLSGVIPEHMTADLTPKKSEIIAAFYRHGGDKAKASLFYEEQMSKCFLEAKRVLKPDGTLAVIYAHKTTLGWATLVDSLRRSGFQVTEAWPLDTERPGGMKVDKAMLASSIFLACRKRTDERAGSYDEVRPELERIVRERVSSLWEFGISGADLVIACVGAGLRAFTRFAKVEYANGEEVPAERFLTEVEAAVLETILGRLSREVAGTTQRGLADVDAPTRFYTLWRYTYKSSDLDAGEAIIFANGTHVELDGMQGLAHGSRPLVEKKKSNYRLLDYSERGDDASLGLQSEAGEPAPLIDSLHRLLWLVEHRPSGIPEFLRETRPNTEQLRLVAQALSGPALKGSELDEVASGTELAALTKLTANWRSVVEGADLTPGERKAERAGQGKLGLERGGSR